MKKIFCVLMAVVIFYSVSVPMRADNQFIFDAPFACEDCEDLDLLVGGWFDGSNWVLYCTCQCGDFYFDIGSYDNLPLHIRSVDGSENYDIVDDRSFTLEIRGGKSYYLVFDEPVQSIITGEPVPNAEYYQLYEKRDSNYVLVRTNGELYFDLNEIMLEPGYDMPGDYIFVVVACGEGFESSDYSNEVVYTAK